MIVVFAWQEPHFVKHNHTNKHKLKEDSYINVINNIVMADV